MHAHVRPHTYVGLRLASGVVKVVQLVPNTYIQATHARRVV